MYSLQVPRRKLSDDERALGGAVGSLLAQGRKLRGMSSQDLSRQCGVSVDAIRSIETGRVASPGLYVVVRMAHALELSMEEVASPIRANLNSSPPLPAPGTDPQALDELEGPTS